MTPQEFSEAIKFLGVTQIRLAGILGVNTRTISRWMDGSTKISVSIGYLLNSWMELKRLGLEWCPIIESDQLCPKCDVYFPFWSIDEKAKYAMHIIRCKEIL